MFGEQTFAQLRMDLMHIRSCKYAQSVPYRLLFILQSSPSDVEPLCAVAATVRVLPTELLSPKIINTRIYNLWSRPVVLPRCRVVVSFPHQSKAAARCVRPLFLISPVWRQGVSDFYPTVVVSFPHQSSVAARCVRVLPSVVVSFSHQSSVAARSVRTTGNWT